MKREWSRSVGDACTAFRHLDGEGKLDPPTTTRKLEQEAVEELTLQWAVPADEWTRWSATQNIVALEPQSDSTKPRVRNLTPPVFGT